MRTLLLLNCYLFLIGYSLADNDGGCTIDGISDLDFSTIYSLGIDDTQIGTAIVEHEYTGPLSVVDFTTTEYFIVSNNDTHFIIRTTPIFGSFDERTPKQSLTVVLENLNVHIQCATGISTLAIQIAVTDINTHAPVFSLSNYEFRVAAPIMPKTDFSIYGDAPITATDVDFSNQNIIFTVTPDDFDITTMSSTTSKDYSVAFRAKKVIQVIGVQTYTITATDTGTNPGPLSSTATFALIVDDATSLDTPMFVKTSYSFNYTIDDDAPNLMPLDGQIAIRTNKRNIITDPVLAGEFSEFFEATLDRNTVRIELTPKGILPVDTGSFFILTVSVTTDNTAAASIIVYRRQSDIDPTPKFSSHVYIGSYSDATGEVTLNGDYITVTSPTVPTVTISGDDLYAEYFTITPQADGYVVTVSKPLTSDILSHEISIALTLVATVGTSTSYATLVINLPATVKDRGIEFAQTLYNGVYKVDDSSFQVTDTIRVETDENDANVEYSISSNTGYEQYFGISYAGKIITVRATEIPTNLLRGRSIIPLLLRVGITGTQDSSTAVLNVKIENNDEDYTPILFSNILYHGRYEVIDGVGNLAIDGTIDIETDEVDGNVEVSISKDYETYFIATYLNKVVTVTLRGQLPTTILESHSFIPLTLQIGVKETTNQASAVLNIEVIYDSEADTGSIEFTAVLYDGEYSVSDGTGHLVLNKTIQVITDTSDEKIIPSISNEAGYDRYFTVAYSNKVLSLGLAQGSLPQDVSVRSFIALTLTVAISGTTHTSSAVVNINIVSDNSNSDSDDDGCPMKTTYIVLIVILSILVIGLIAAAVAFYYFKLRSKNYANLDEERDPRTRYERNLPPTRGSTDVKHTPLDERRPTGFIFKPLDEDTTDTTNDFDKNRRKSVAFDDNVEKMQIESPIDEDNDASEDDNNISDKSEVTHV